MERNIAQFNAVIECCQSFSVYIVIHRIGSLQYFFNPLDGGTAFLHVAEGSGKCFCRVDDVVKNSEVGKKYRSFQCDLVRKHQPPAKIQDAAKYQYAQKF